MTPSEQIEKLLERMKKQIERDARQSKYQPPPAPIQIIKLPEKKTP